MLGIVLADRGGLSPDIALALAFCALGVGIAAGRRESLRAVCACAVALCSGAIALGSQQEASRFARPIQRTERTLEGTVRESRVGRSFWRVVLDDVASVDGEGPLPASVLIRGESRTDELLMSSHPGDRLRLRARLRSPRTARNPGGREEAQEFARAGIGAVGRLIEPAFAVRMPAREGGRPLASLWRFREATGKRLAGAGEGGGLLRALALGDRRGLSADTTEGFARLGLSHLLAVSGLHLGLVAAMSFAVARRTLRLSARLALLCNLDWLALVCSAAAACAYAILAGWGVPVRRALVFLSALALASLCARRGPRSHPLALAALIVLAEEPEALFSAGAQLSFAACGALLFSARGDSGEMRDPSERSLPRLFRTSAAAVAATAPLAAWHMGRVAPIALLTNTVAIPWTAFVLLPSALCAALISPFSEFRALLSLAETVARITQISVEFLAARIPAVDASPSPEWSGCMLAACVGLAAILARGTALRCALVILECVVLAATPTAPLAPAPPRAVVLDVGQGDATLIQGRGGTVLIDAGTAIPDGIDMGRSRVVPALQVLGVRRIDLLLATHADLDHRGGIPAVLELLPVAALWVPFGATLDPGFDVVMAAARRRGVPVFERGAGSAPQRLGDLAVVPLWPPPLETRRRNRFPGRPSAPAWSSTAEGRGHASRNNRSLVVRVELAGTRLLFPGDIERAGEEALLASGADLRADVLELPHHGSRTSSSAAFLAEVDASIALVSAPCFGRFGMPHGEVVRRAREAGLAIWWTGRDGALWLRAVHGRGRSLAIWGHAEDGPQCELSPGASARASPSDSS